MQTRRQKLELVAQTLEKWRAFARPRQVATAEFAERRRRVWQAVSAAPYNADVGFVFCDEHYAGDVPYLFGNTNVAIEQVAGALGPDSLDRSGIIAGFEGVYIAGQLARRGGVRVYPTESLQLADEIYPVEGFTLKDILYKIAGREVRRIALLTPRQVLPAGILANLEAIAGGPANVIDAQVPFQQLKNLKSDTEMALLRDAANGTSLMLRAMLAVIEPGMLETEVAAYGELAAKLWGLERFGFPTMVGSDEANVTMIGPCLNRPVQAGAFVHLGASGKRDGLTACCRRSIIAGGDAGTEQAFWRDLVEGAFRTGFDKYLEVAGKNLPARLQEQSLVDYYNSRTDAAVAHVAAVHGQAKAAEFKRRLFAASPLPAGLARQKPYTGTHNAGYTECQEFYGAITLESAKALEPQVVTMLDVALRGRGSSWDDIVIPGFDYFVVEDTLGKFGTRVENLTGSFVGNGREKAAPGKLPVRVQELIGNANV